MDLLDFLSALLSAPVPSILTLAGLVFIFLSFFNVRVVERIGDTPWTIRLVGFGFTALGIVLFIAVPTLPGEIGGESGGQEGQALTFNCPAHDRAEATTGTVPGHADIDSPKGGAVVPYQNFVTGTCADVPTDVDLWVMVYSWPVGRFYPQSQDDPPVPATRATPTTWSSTAFVGLEGEQNMGECHDIIVVAANEEGSHGIAQILEEWSDRGRWPGLTPAELPSGIEEKDAVTVQRGY